ncbi:hypothetical protein D9V41_06210 [Aeromicrobium phragmitis]|uniref:Uncharacterized protein n=1 Tax=Aeromicrobium phragmitis TaxID=2478914 RepID=A0A3L8PMS9_9ACTN|nr:hypothetical protein D9V41_06210 [Aeromicrobium phragmitis]
MDALGKGENVVGDLVVGLCWQGTEFVVPEVVDRFGREEAVADLAFRVARLGCFAPVGVSCSREGDGYDE